MGSGEWDAKDESDARRLILKGAEPGAFWSSGEKDAERVLRWTTKDSWVIDFGCGIGRVAKFVAPNVDRMACVDVSTSMLHLCEQNIGHDRRTFSHAPDLKEFGPARDDDTLVRQPVGVWDVIYSFFVLQHIDKADVLLILGQMHDALKPHGRVVLQFPHIVGVYYDATRNDPTRSDTRARPYAVEEVLYILARERFLLTEMVVEGNEMFVVAERV